MCDQLYGSRENRRYLKDRGIRFGGKALGRPKKKTVENAESIRLEKLQRIQDSRDRIPIEGKFGQGKNGYRLNHIRARLQKTSEAWINCIFLVMNLMVLLRELYEMIVRPSFFAVFFRLNELILDLRRELYKFCPKLLAA